MNYQVMIFDADNTLWQTAKGEYVSRVKSEFVLGKIDMVKRVKDGAEFSLNSGIKKFLKDFTRGGGKVGLMSDNHFKDVKLVCEFFDIWKYFDLRLVSIRLYKGYCPKAEIVNKLLRKNQVSERFALWLDDKDYSIEAEEFNLKFIQVKNNLVEEILSKICIM